MLIIIMLDVELVRVQYPVIPGSAQDTAHFLGLFWFGAAERIKKIKKEENSSMDFIMPILILAVYFVLMKFVLPKIGIPT
jgi:hypothetical protein